jgi:Ca2+-binding EF-hand superfamily protein
MKNGQPWLFAKLRRDDGTHVDASSPFNDNLDTFTAVNGELVTGCCVGVGRLTTRDIVSMCDLYDEMDFGGYGFLTAPNLWNFVKSMGLRQVKEDEIVKLVADFDLDAGEPTESKGLDFPEFMMLTAGSLGTGYTCQMEMKRFWDELTKDSASGRLEVQGLSRWLEEAHIQEDEATLQAFMAQYGCKDGTMEQDSLYSIFLNAPKRSEGQDFEVKIVEEPLAALSDCCSNV